MKNKLVRTMAAGFAAAMLLSGCGGNGASGVAESTEAKPTEEPVVETASDKDANTDTTETETTMAPEEAPAELQYDNVSYLDLSPEDANKKYEQDLINMKFDDYYQLVIDQAKENASGSNDKKRYLIGHYMDRMFLDYRRLTSSDGTEEYTNNIGSTVNKFSSKNIPTFDTEEHRAGYDRLRELYMSLYGTPDNLKEAKEVIINHENRESEFGTTNSLETGMTHISIRIIANLEDKAKEQNYTEIDFDTISTLDFVDWFCDKFQNGDYYNKYAAQSYWEDYQSDLIYEVDLTKRYILMWNGEEDILVEVDEDGQPVDSTIELQERDGTTSFITDEYPVF